MCVSIWGLYISYSINKQLFSHRNFGIKVTVTDSSASSTKAVKAVLKVASSRKKKTPSFSAAKFAVAKKNGLERKTHEIQKKNIQPKMEILGFAVQR